MTDMAVKPTGDVDHDFVAMMVPHHKGAIDMAQAELQYGQSPQLKTVAQEIIVGQIQEITLMRLALGVHPVQARTGQWNTPSRSATATAAARSETPSLR